MDNSIILSAILSPFILFFLLGYFLKLIKSDVRIPSEITEAMQIFLLLAIGLGGGVKVAETIVKNPAAIQLIIPAALFAIVIGFAIAASAFFILFKVIGLDASNSGAVAAHNGAVSTATMILGMTFLAEMPFETMPFAVVLYPLMDTPALITGIVLASFFLARQGKNEEIKIEPIGRIILESFRGKGVVLIVAGVIIGIVAGSYSPKTTTEVMVLFDGIFKGVLTLFLMEMGMVAASRMGELWHIRKVIGKVFIYAALLPFITGPLILIIGWSLGLDPYLATFLAIIGASSSYVSAPAACRASLPKANPSIYIGQSLGIIFPLNVMINIPFVILPLSQFLFK